MWLYSTGKERSGAYARPAGDASTGLLQTGSPYGSDIVSKQDSTRPNRFVRTVFLGCAALVVASCFVLQCAFADLAPPPGQPKPPRPTPKPDPPSQTSLGIFSGFSTKEALVGTGCLVASVEILAVAGLVVSRRKRKDETDSKGSHADR